MIAYCNQLNTPRLSLSSLRLCSLRLFQKAAGATQKRTCSLLPCKKLISR